MKKFILLGLLMVFTIQVKAQYGTLDAILTRLENRKGINKSAKNIDINGKKFIQINDFKDHTERKFIIFKDNKVTYVEISDDKATEESTSKVYVGDVKRSKHNIISIRADKLEGKKIPIALTKTFLFTQLENIIYLIDVNNKERWIEENAFKRNKK